MFDVLRKRMVSAMGVRVCSFDDLDRMDLDSVDSVCISDSGSIASVSTATSTEYAEVIRAEGLDDLVKRKIAKMLRFIKKMEKLHTTKETKMSLLPFMDMIRDQQYAHVSMSLLQQFMKTCKMVPKPYYLHYFMFFLHYAAFYHYVRGTTDVIDQNMKHVHEKHLRYIKLQLKYLQYIIQESRVREVAL